MAILEELLPGGAVVLKGVPVNTGVSKGAKYSNKVETLTFLFI